MSNVRRFTLPKLDHSGLIYLPNLFDEQVVGSVQAKQRHICHKFFCCLRLCMTQTYESNPSVYIRNSFKANVLSVSSLPEFRDNEIVRGKYEYSNT